MKSQRRNVFESLGIAAEDASELLIRSALLVAVRRVIRERGFDHDDAVDLFGVSPTQIRSVRRGRVDEFSAGLLTRMLASAAIHPTIGTGARTATDGLRHELVTADGVADRGDPELRDSPWVLLWTAQDRPGASALAVSRSLEDAKVEAARWAGQELTWYHQSGAPHASLPWSRERWVAELEWTDDPEEWSPETIWLVIQSVPFR